MPINRPLLVTQQVSLRNKRSQLRAQAANAMEEVRKELAKTTLEIVQELILSYPPELPDQKYVRTFTLMGSWEWRGPIDSPDGSVMFEITNAATDPDGRLYAALVQDEDNQVPVHQGRWPTVQEIQEEYARTQSNRVRGAIQRAFRS